MEVLHSTSYHYCTDSFPLSDFEHGVMTGDLGSNRGPSGTGLFSNHGHHCHTETGSTANLNIIILKNQHIQLVILKLDGW